jgi:DNA-binding SARP family transcriptional activator
MRVFGARRQCYRRHEVEFRILGPLEVLDRDRPIEIAGSKRRAVLALLLLHANEIVRTDRLIDHLWGERAPRNAPAALQSHISRLRKALGSDVLARREWGYVLRTEPDSIDLHRFKQLLAAAEPLPAAERSVKLAEALKLWRGPALADLANESGLQTEIARLEELWLTTLERRIDADLESGRADVVGELEALIAAHPLREHLRWQLILALYRAGRQAEALEIYRETRRMLTEELGLDPSPALKELEMAILRQDPAISAATSVPPAVERASTRRRPVTLAALALLAFALGGVGLTFALVRHGRSHVAHAAQVAATTPPPESTSSEPRPRKQQIVRRERRPRHNVRGVGHRAARRAVRLHAPRSTPASVPKPSTQTQAEMTTKRQISIKPRTVTISDNFGGNEIDPTIWYQSPYQGSGWALSEHEGHLEFMFPPGTAPGVNSGGQWDNYGGHVGTKCIFPGDFDARVDFTLVEWPAANSIVVNLWTFFKPRATEMHGSSSAEGWDATRSSSTQWGEQYGAYLGDGRGRPVSLNDLSGTLRLTRRNGVVTAYFLQKGKWISLGSAHKAGPTVIGVGAQSVQNPPVRVDQAVVDFDNFTITATNPICPPGSYP